MLFIWPEKTEWQLQKQQHQQQYRALAINDSEEKINAEMGQINEKKTARDDDDGFTLNNSTHLHQKIPNEHLMGV